MTYEKRNHRRRASDETLDELKEAASRRMFYWAYIVAGLALTPMLLYGMWGIANAFTLLGVFFAGAATTLWVVWLLMDANDELLECPMWLRVSILACTFISMGAFAVSPLVDWL